MDCFGIRIIIFSWYLLIFRANKIKTVDNLIIHFNLQLNKLKNEKM